MEDFGGEEKAFVVDEINAVIKESIESTIQNAPYHHNKVGQWNSNIVEQCLKKLTGLNKPFKYISTCTIMQKNGAGLHVASSCFWDNASDGNVKYYNEKRVCIDPNFDFYHQSSRLVDEKNRSVSTLTLALIEMFPSNLLFGSPSLFARRCGPQTLQLYNQLFKSISQGFKRSSPAVVKYFPDYDNRDLFIQACKKGDISQVENFLNDPKIDPAICENAGILLAMEAGHLLVVKRLINDPRINLADHRNLLFRMVCSAGLVGIAFKLLLKDEINPGDCNNESLRYALTKYHIGVTKMLLLDSRVDPSAGNNMAIAYCSGFGKYDLVKKMLQDERVDPSANNNAAIIYACRKGHPKIVEALLQDSRVNPSDAIRLAEILQEESVLDVFRKHSLYGQKFIVSSNNVTNIDTADQNKLSNQDIGMISKTSNTVPKTCNDEITQETPNLLSEKYKKIIEAISQRRVGKALRLLDNAGIDASLMDNNAIRLASAEGLLKIVQKLLQNPHVDPSALDNEALRISTFMGNLDVAMELVKDSRVDPSAGNNALLRRCAYSGEEKMVELLMSHPNVDPSDLNNTAIEAALTSRHFSIVKQLLKDPRVDPNAGNGLVSICHHGQLELLDQLLKENRIDPSVNQNAALHWAVRAEKLEIVKRLMQDERVVISPRELYTGFEFRRESILEFIFQHPRFDVTFDGNAPIIFACEGGFLKLVQILLKNPKVDPTVWDNLPIRVAAICGHYDIVETLIKDQRVDPFAQENIVKHIAKSHAQYNIINLLDLHPKNLETIITQQSTKFVEEQKDWTSTILNGRRELKNTPVPDLSGENFERWEYKHHTPVDF